MKKKKKKEIKTFWVGSEVAVGWVRANKHFFFFFFFFWPYFVVLILSQVCWFVSFLRVTKPGFPHSNTRFPQYSADPVASLSARSGVLR